MEKHIENVNHWSYSSAKNIYHSGIDYAVGLKIGLIEKTYGKAVDIGKLAHAHLLGGEQEFVVKQYPDYRTKEAREWRDAQTLPIIDEAEFETICTIAERIKSHPLANQLVLGETRLNSKPKSRAKTGLVELTLLAFRATKSNIVSTSKLLLGLMTLSGKLVEWTTIYKQHFIH